MRRCFLGRWQTRIGTTLLAVRLSLVVVPRGEGVVRTIFP
jgi:hypothetical protein